MAKTLRTKARYVKGKLELLKPSELEEGAEVTLTVIRLRQRETTQDPTEATTGAWKDLLDCARFEKEVYASRLIQTRPEVKV
ncbi:MAG: antitoxin family protein [candidate division NC10 bacterium]|nr:antitoxin family protein [candidate division NC10 bacterium]